MRTFIAVAAAIAATSVSFAVATAANQPTGPVAQGSASADRAVLKQLKALNRTTKKMNSKLATAARTLGHNSTQGIWNENRQLGLRLDRIHQALGENDYGIGVRARLKGVEDLLKTVCRAVRPSIHGYSCI